MIQRRTVLKGMAAGAAIAFRAGRAGAEDVLKMGVEHPSDRRGL